MSVASRHADLCQFSRHTPRILRRQLILQLAEQYLGQDKSEDLKQAAVCKPSIQRFNGALLFVDISGFTVLSQRLSVEELKNHINIYFTTMLDIVDKHGGDVIKFAGDALFIVWESCTTVVAEGIKHSFEELSKIAVEKAVECGKEINETCSNHKIVLNQNRAPRRISYDNDGPISSSSGHLSAAQMMNNFHSGHGQSPTHSSMAAVASATVEEECAYLNVHSGVSVGLMAGIDIGADNRWEYFLIGEPLSKVAEAESQASSGDMIMCPESHALLHSPEFSSSSGSSASGKFSHIVSQFRTKLRWDQSGSDSCLLPCGCTSLKNGYCKIKSNPNVNREARKARRTKRGSMSQEETNSLLDAINVDLKDVIKAHDVQFKKEYLKHTQSIRLMKPGRLRHGNGDMNEEVMQRAFYEWAEACLTDDIARHVHHVMRSEYAFSDISRQGAYERDFEEAWAIHSHHHHTSQSQQQQQLQEAHSPLGLHRDNLHSQSEAILPQILNPVTPSGSGASLLSSGSSKSPLMRMRSMSPMNQTVNPNPVPTSTSPITDGLMIRTDSRQSLDSDGGTSVSSVQTPSAPNSVRNSFSRRNLLKTALSPQNNVTSLSAELRNVTVMFVKINITDTELLIDSSVRAKVGGSYRFLGTTLNERVADQRLLARYQKCIEVLSGALTSYGGQMRQFIVDDKGTVCIGTFGLRGSVSDDNAAAALDAANAIVLQLQTLGLQCSIGVTVGRAYCGLVGSSNRHEYAVMGPSTNLSARLMCKAPAYGVICDAATKMRDRIHGFVALKDVVAKGYSAPVGTFQPVFPEVEAFLSAQQEFSSSYHRVGEESGSASLTHHSKVVRRMIAAANRRTTKLHGRSEELTRAIGFAFNGLVHDHVINGTSSKEDGVTTSLFDTEQLARFVGIIATDGMGKSHLATSIAERVYAVSKNTSGCNIQMFKSRFDSYSSNAPFNAWRPIVMEMITRIYRNASKKLTSATTATTASGRSSAVSASSEINDSITCVMSMLSEELQHLTPLFGFISIGSVRSESLKAMEMTTQDKICNCIKLLLAVIELYTSTSQNLIFITMDDVQSYDEASLHLMNEIYAAGKGIIIVFTGRTTKHSGAKTESVDPGNVLRDFIAPIKKSARFLELELEGLSKSATIELIQSALEGMGIHEEDNAFYDRVYEVSGGNPLYAYEIAKSFANHELAGKDAAPMAHNVRTEEVICYRFDQLKTSAQSLLKMAAVICANKATFSLTMLTRLEDWDLLEGCESFAYPVLTDAEELTWDADESFSMEEVYSATRVKYAKILYSILRYESFLRVAASQTDLVDDESFEDSSVEQLLTSNAAFEFAIPLEQSTIYNLLLDDQKHALHEGVAEYVHRSSAAGDHASGLEEGFHWHKAAVWTKSIMCYFQAYEKETSDPHRRRDHLDLAYQALQGLASGGETKHLGVSFVNLKGMFEEAMSGGELKLQPVHNEEAPVITLERTHEIFRGDSNLLFIGVTILLLVAQQRKHRFETSSYTQLILEDALQIALLTKNPFLMSASYLEMLTKPKTRIDGGELDSEDMHFCLRHFWPLFFSILNTYCMNYVVATTAASDYSRKAAYVAEQFLACARTEGSTIDIIQALNASVLVQNKLSNMKTSLQFIDELLAIYKFELHSASLVEWYGADQVIYTLTRTSKYLILSGEKDKANKFIENSVRLFSGLTHMASLTLSVLRLVSVLAYVDRFKEAMELLERYEKVVSQKILHPTEFIPTKIIALCRAWLNRHMAVVSKKGEQESKETLDLIGQVEVMMSTKEKHAIEANSVLLYHKQEILIILADLYAMKVRRDASVESELTNDCLVCCMYLQNVMTAQTVGTYDVFSKARAVKMVLQILKVLQERIKLKEYLKRFQKVFTEPVLLDLRREAQINQLHVLNRDTGELSQFLCSAVCK